VLRGRSERHEHRQEQVADPGGEGVRRRLRRSVAARLLHHRLHAGPALRHRERTLRLEARVAEAAAQHHRVLQRERRAVPCARRSGVHGVADHAHTDPVAQRFRETIIEAIAEPRPRRRKR